MILGYGGGYGEFYGGSLEVGGSMSSGMGHGSASIQGGFSIPSIKVAGELRGTAESPLQIDAYGEISKVTIGGSVQFASITCGTDQGYAYEYVGIGNPDAQIGTVIVGGDWVASSIAAGIAANNGHFGDADDLKVGDFDDPEIASRIAKITIGGRTRGVPGGDVSHGFVSQEIGMLSVGGVQLPLTKGASNDFLYLDSINRFVVNEISG